MTSDRIVFRCLEVRQPIGEFYIGAMDSADLVAVAYADIRRIEARDVERYIGIERPLSTQRVTELMKYVKTVDATFPTGIILAVKSEDAEYNDDKGVMALRREEKVATILDGQHRIAGLQAYRGPSFQVNVVLFVDMDIEDQATVFATINLTQTKVGKSLAYDLFEYARARSPQKTAHNIARLLNSEAGSPFKDRIKILGRATPGKEETITQAAFVDRLLPYLTTNAMGDRDLLKRGQKPAPPKPQEIDTLIFRKMFVEERDDDIALVVWNFFTSVSRRWTYAWNTKEGGNILNRTTGFAGLMRFLRVAYNAAGRRGAVVPVEWFETVFSKVTLRDADFTPDRFKPGGSGEAALLKELSSQTDLGKTS